MTTAVKTNKFLSLGDRFAELAVLLLVVVALLLGVWLKTSVENRSAAFSGSGITAQVPVGWISGKLGTGEVLHLSDRTASGFGTTYIIQEAAVPADATNASFAGLLTMQRGSDLTGYRVLDQKDVLVQGRQAVEVEYVYVESADNLVDAVLPQVVHGLDYIFVDQGKAVVVTYRSDQSTYTTNLARFQRFLVSVQY